MSEAPSVRTFLPETEFFGVSPVMIVDEGLFVVFVGLVGVTISTNPAQSSMRSMTISLTPRTVCAQLWRSPGLSQRVSSKLSRCVSIRESVIFVWIVLSIYSRHLILIHSPALPLKWNGHLTT